MTAEKPSVDDLRNRLRELGYLDAGVDRFVLGPVRGGRRLASVAARSSVRIGTLAGLLLGPSAAVALSIRVPGLVTGIRDAVVLAAYLGLLLGVGVALAAFLASLLLGALVGRIGGPSAERARLLARVAGLLVAASCLVYLVLWWRAVSPAGTVWRSVAWTLPALAATSALSVLLGHAVTLTTLALMLHAAGAAAPDLRLRSRSWTLTVGLGVAGFAAAAGLLFLVTRGESPAPPSASRPVSRVDTGARLGVLGVDGLDLQFVARLRARGGLQRLGWMLDGARAVLPPSDAPDPARTWTSLATGQPAGVHGVSGIETRRVSGIEGTVSTGESALGASIAAATDALRLTRPALTSSLQRRSKTFWEVAADHGLRTLVVNWWATWPAPDGPGIVLTDRATLRLSRGGELDAEIAPAALYPALRDAWPGVLDTARARVLAAFPDSDDQSRILRSAGEQDAVSVALAVRLGLEAADLWAVYLPGLDIAQHGLLGAAAGRGLPASALASRVEALERYYVFLDALVAPLVESPPSGRLLALVADPGRATADAAGLLALAGDVARPAAATSLARADVMPTLLYALGVPASRELPGRPRAGLFTDAFTARVPVREVDSYGPRVIASRPPSATPLDQEMLERLKSLGYVR